LDPKIVHVLTAAANSFPELAAFQSDILLIFVLL